MLATRVIIPAFRRKDKTVFGSVDGEGAIRGSINMSFINYATMPQMINVTRPGNTATYWDAQGNRQVAPANTARQDYNPITLMPEGIKVEGPSTNLFLNSTAPVTQTITLTTGTHILWVEGSGTMTVAAGTAVGTGFGSATGGAKGTYGSFVKFNITTAGTVTVTKSGTVTATQLEKRNKPSTLIITGASPVSRAGDDVDILDLSKIKFSKTEGTLMVEWKNDYVSGTGDSAGIVSFNNGTSSQKISFVKNSSDEKVTTQYYYGGPPVTVSSVKTMSFSGANRAAVSYKSGDNASSLNGGATVGSNAPVPTIDRLQIGRDPDMGYLNGWIRVINYSKPADPNPLLQTNTSGRNVFTPIVYIQSGSGYAGSVYAAFKGVWVDDEAFTFSYQWKSNGVPIAGATSANYTSVSDDIGKTLSCDVTGVSSFITQTFTSNGIKLASPIDVPNLKLWIDVNDPSTITKDGSNIVSQINDKSGNNNHFTAALSGNRPTFIASDLNGLPSLSFTDTANNATSSRMIATNNTAYNEETIFMVMSAAPITGSADTPFSHSSSNNYSFGQHNSTNVTVWNVTAGTAGLGLTAPYKSEESKFIVLSGRRSAVMNEIALYQNGANLGKDTMTVGATASGKYLLGYDLRNNNCTMKFCELLVYDRFMTDSERFTIENYLNRKWGGIYANPDGLRTYNQTVQLNFFKNNYNSLSQLPARKKVVLLAGQSNAAGTAPTSGLPSILTNPIANALTWNHGATDWQTLQAGVNNQPNTAGNFHGIELSLMYDLAQTFGDYYLFKHAVGSTNLAVYWMPPSGAGWGNMTARYKTAIKKIGYENGQQLDPSMFIWMQGEADSSDPAMSQAYEANLTFFINSVRATMEGCANVPFLINRCRWDTTTYPAGLALVQQAENNVANNMSNVSLFGPWAVSGGDGLHANSNSHVILGDTAANRLGATVSVSGVSMT